MSRLNNLRAAFPAMPDDCRTALMNTARSVKQEEPMKRKFSAVILAAGILTLMTTIAIAEGWNVLQFLGLQPDSDAQRLVQPVSVSSTVGNVTMTIASAITDGEYLAFDYTVTNAHPETPVYLRVEDFTANGKPISTDGTDDFHNQWLPGWCNDGVMMDGEWSQLPVLTGDILRVEMVIGVYAPEKPVCLMDDFDAAAIRQKWEEGYYVIVGGDGMVFYHPEEDALFHGFPGQVLDHEAQGLLRSEMKVSFDLDLNAARASVRRPELPSPVIRDGATLAVQSVAISPLQTRIVATFTPESASYEEIVSWADGMRFSLYDLSGHALVDWDLAANVDGGSCVQEANDGTWYLRWEMTYIDPTPAMPTEGVLVYEARNGFRAELPIPLK